MIFSLKFLFFSKKRRQNGAIHVDLAIFELNIFGHFFANFIFWG